MNVKFVKGIPDLSKRSSGLLLHVTSLPGQYGIGDLGPAAYQWVDMLAKAGQTWWQMLPLGPCGEGNSPYRSYSAFAGNSLLISPDLLMQDKLVRPADLRGMPLPNGPLDYKKASLNKMAILSLAYQRFCNGRFVKLANEFHRFAAAQADWLDDFALFSALRQVHPGISWTQWPVSLRARNPSALHEARVQHAHAVDFQKFIQFLFFRQLNSLRAHARKSGVSLIGDLPIFVSPESADVWTHPHLFQLDQNLNPTVVSGVPPDLFSATGQRWGNPLYNWKTMAKDKFAWWKARLRSALAQADLVRIDHFRGFESCWTIPAGAPTAKTGKWIKGPGAQLFEALIGGQDCLPLVAEDLGIITPEVEALRDQFNLPGMRVLQFGFTPEPGNPHTPHNFIRHCFAYTGTHDNDTTVGWYTSLPAAAQLRLQQYAPHVDWNQASSWACIQVLMSSIANHAIVPVQDLLSLDSWARMNTPGQSHNNWNWRLPSFADCIKPLMRLEKLTHIYER